MNDYYEDGILVSENAACFNQTVDNFNVAKLMNPDH